MYCAELEAVHRVRWSPHGSWLAHGGAAGLVRCQVVAADT